MPVAPSAQSRRATHRACARSRANGGPQEQEFLLVEYVPTWLVLINTARVSEANREKLVWYQRYIIREVYQAFAALTQLPARSTQIEDLADLGRVDSVLTLLAEQQHAVLRRQEALEESQDHARDAWRDLRTAIEAIHARLNQLEHSQSGAITPAQRGYLYQLVQAWGAAKAAQEPRLTRSGAFAACWTALKPRYRIARYEDLPAHQYRDAVAFVQHAYTQLTGTPLVIPEQTELPLGDKEP